MSITFEQALTAQRFHIGTCSVTYGKTGKAQPKVDMEEWRRNGQTKTWKTRPGEFRVPVKFGLHQYGYVDDRDAEFGHVAEECPALAEADAWWDAKTLENAWGIR